MGDEVLMKTLVILLLFVLMLFSNTTSNKEASIEKFRFMFEKIGEKRVGVNDAKVDSIVIPFEKPIVKKIVKKDSKSDKKVTKQVVQPKKTIVSYELQAILNKRAKINGKWYKLNSKIDDYKIISIKDGVVWLKNSMHKKRLTIRKKNEKITIK